jgi:hypothetical protein
MSEVKVNKITPTTNCGTVTLGDSGDTIAIPAGVTLTSGGALQNSGTITNTGSITGLAITGTIDNQVNWQTTVKTSNFTASAGEGYFCNTTSGAFTVTLPASPSAGDLVGIKDYANTADTNNIIIGRNGSNIEGVANDFVISVEGGSITLIYVDATKGWLSTAAAKASDITQQATFITATGGTITTAPCGDFKIHTFTGPGTFTVCSVGNPIGSSTVDYLVIAGGGGAGGGGGGGAGGYRESSGAASGCYPRSPLGACVSALPVSAQGYPITVGAGASGQGADSIFSTITSAGGGGGVNAVPNGPLNDGGSGGGINSPTGGAAGVGNTPPVSPPQGNPGGGTGNGGGGGAAAAGVGGAGATGAGAGGAGTASSITGSPVSRAGGGGAAAPCGAAPGGVGGGGAGGPNGGTNGTVNTGGGGGANWFSGNRGSGGSGIVVIRYKFQ